MSSFFTKVRSYCLARTILNGRLDSMPDEKALVIIYFLTLGKKPNLEHPVKYTEKLQWLKLHDRKDIYTLMVDKYSAKEYIAARVGKEHVIPLLGVWEHFSEIDFDSLPDSFVLKCTHDSGSVKTYASKDKLNISSDEAFFEARLKRNYYRNFREWPYKNVEPRIIAEPYMRDINNAEALTDYKFFCFNGEPKIMYIAMDRSSIPYTRFFDTDFNPLNIKMKDPLAETLPDKPSHFEEMKEMAAKLSFGIPHLRVDFYTANDVVYVGELTFFHSAGFPKISPPEWDDILGNWITLPEA